MGNCLFGGMDLPGGAGTDANGSDAVIKVVTTNGGIMEFCSPITVEFITDEFPGHGIFRVTGDVFWKPLSHQQLLEAGQSYYLLPLGGGVGGATPSVRIGHVRSSSASSHIQRETESTPYRMSFESRGILKRSQAAAVAAARQQFSASGGESKKTKKKKKVNSGVWKVKLVISPQQLMEILSQEAKTEELIESVRTVAKCRIKGGSGGADSPAIFSGQWSSVSGCSSASSSRRMNFAAGSTCSDKDPLSIEYF